MSGGPSVRELRGATESPWPKQCRCGASFFADAWRALTLCGYMEDGLGGRLELRHCIACGSTIAMKARSLADPTE